MKVGSVRTIGAVLSLAIILGTAPAIAANPSPGFDSAQWAQLIQRIQKQGMPQEDGSLSLTRGAPAGTNQSHTYDLISLISGGGEIGAISENWILESNGNWDVDQWIFESTLKGELVTVSHSMRVEDPDGRIISDQTLPETGHPSDAGVLQHWGDTLKGWYSSAL